MQKLLFKDGSKVHGGNARWRQIMGDVVVMACPSDDQLLRAVEWSANDSDL